VKAQPGKIVRTSFIDLDDDIVQVEFSGAGTLTIRLEAASDPAAPVNYVQPGVNYVKGHATIEITEADESSYLTIFSVGKITALNQTLFRDDATYDGVADVALVTIHSRNGKFAELRTGNAHYFAGSGLTGVYAPGVSFNKVFIGDVTGDDDAIAVILTGAVADARITGGSLEQLNGGSVEVGEIDRLQFTDGMTSHGATLPAQSNRGKLVRGGVDVTAELVR
ncbi:MAG TPA: serine hydrolase, partial [Opitutus sp.]|nr:serine hydrolase [Opitutus sp.]